MSDPVQMSLFQNPLVPSQAPGLGFGIQNPIQGILMGQSAGVNQANNALIRQNNAQVQAAQAQAAQAQAAQAQAAQEKQRRIIELARKIAGTDYAEKAADMAELSQLTEPDKFKAAQEGFKALSLEQQHSILRDGGTVISLLRNGNAKAANTYIDERLTAARESGDQRSVQTYMAAKKLIADAKDPKIAATMLEYQLSPFDGSKDMLEAIHSSAAQGGKEELIAAQADAQRAEAETKRGTLASEINKNNAQAYEAMTQGDLNTRLPAEKLAANSAEAKTKIASNQQAIDQLSGVLNGFNQLAVKGALPQTGVVGTAGALTGDWFGRSAPATQWRNAVKSALSNTILERLKDLRPASDKDIEWLQKSVGDVDSDPVMALNAIYRTRELLQYANEALKAQQNGQAVPPYPTNKFANESSLTGGPYGMSGWGPFQTFTFEGREFVPGKGLPETSKQLTDAQKQRLDEINKRISPSGPSSRNMSGR